TSSIRAVYFSTSDRAVNLPDFIPSCNSAIEISFSSNGLISAAAERVAAPAARPALRAGNNAAVPPVVRAACRNRRREAPECDEPIVSPSFVRESFPRKAIHVRPAPSERCCERKSIRTELLHGRLFKHESPPEFTSSRLCRFRGDGKLRSFVRPERE